MCSPQLVVSLLVIVILLIVILCLEKKNKQENLQVSILFKGSIYPDI